MIKYLDIDKFLNLISNKGVVAFVYLLLVCITLCLVSRWTSHYLFR